MPIDIMSPIQALESATMKFVAKNESDKHLKLAQDKLEEDKKRNETYAKQVEKMTSGDQKLQLSELELKKLKEQNKGNKAQFKHDETMAQYNIQNQSELNKGKRADARIAEANPELIKQQNKQLRLKEKLQNIINNPQNSYTPNSDDIKELVNNKKNSTSDYIRNNQVKLMGGDE